MTSSKAARSTTRALAIIGALGLGGLAIAAPTILDEVPASLRLGPNGKPLDATQSAKLVEGKILSEVLADDGKGPRISVAVGIADASPENVRKALRDHPPLDIGDRSYQSRVVEEKKKVDGREVLVSRFDYAAKGSIKASSGTWALVPMLAGEKTFVTYTYRLDPGSTPRNLTGRDVEDALEAVRKRTVPRH